MAHASLLDVWNAGTRTLGQGLEYLTKEKQYELNTIAYNAGLRLETEMHKLLLDTQNSNNPEEIQLAFKNKIQEWKDTVAYPGGNNSKYYREKIDKISAEADANFEKKLYEQSLFRDNQRAYALLTTSLDNTFAAEDDSDNPNMKLERGLWLIQDSYDHNIINPVDKRKEEINWAGRVLSDKLQRISDAAKTPEDLRAAIDTVSAGAYAGYIAEQDVGRAREKAYQQGLNRIQTENQTVIRNMEAEFLEKKKALTRGETEAYMRVLDDLEKQRKSGAISGDEYNSGRARLRQKNRERGFQDSALLRETTELANAGRAFRDSAGPDGFQDVLATSGYFEMGDRNGQTGSGSSGSAENFKSEEINKSLAFGVFAQSMRRPGETMGWAFNAAIDGSVEIADANGLFDNDDEAGTLRQEYVARSIVEIGEELTRLASEHNLATKGNYFAKIYNESKSFMDKKRAAALLGKPENRVTDAELLRLQGNLWDQLMNAAAEIGTAPENRAVLEERIEEIYRVYVDNRFKILYDNAQSKSAAVNDPNKTAQALRTIRENAGVFSKGYFNRGYGPEVIDDTSEAYMNTAANLLANALEWPNDEKTFVYLAQGYVTLARGGDQYRITGEQQDGRETFVVERLETKEMEADNASSAAKLLAEELGWPDDEETHVDVSGGQAVVERNGEKYRIVGKKQDGQEIFVVEQEVTEDDKKQWRIVKQWEKQPAIKIDSRSFGNKFVDFLKYLNQGGANPQTRQTPLQELQNTPGRRFGWQGVQGVR
jgi:hypothetical protein